MTTLANTTAIENEVINTVETIEAVIETPAKVLQPCFKTTNVDDICFPVDIVENTDFVCNSDYKFDVFAYPNGQKIRVNCCSDRYNLVPNSEIFKPVEKILTENNIPFSAEYECINYSRFYADYKINTGEIEVTSGDIIYPILRVQHSYNGLTKYKIHFGYFRLICTNGLTIPVKEKENLNLSITGKHTDKLDQQLSELITKINLFISEDISKTFSKRFQDLSGSMVTNWADRVLECLTVGNITNVDNSKFNTMKSIEETIKSEAKTLYGDETKVNEWLIYNAINKYLFSDRTSQAKELKEEKDSKILTHILKTANISVN